MPKLSRNAAALVAGSMVLASTGVFAQDAPKDVQKQIDEIKSVLPKFAIPMREVGDRFQNMYFAAKGGNWALAAYMSKYMNGSMGPASVTKPDEYKTWKNFYDNTLSRRGPRPFRRRISRRSIRPILQRLKPAMAAMRAWVTGS